MPRRPPPPPPPPPREPLVPRGGSHPRHRREGDSLSDHYPRVALALLLGAMVLALLTGAAASVWARSGSGRATVAVLGGPAEGVKAVAHPPYVQPPPILKGAPAPEGGGPAPGDAGAGDLAGPDQDAEPAEPEGPPVAVPDEDGCYDRCVWDAASPSYTEGLGGLVLSELVYRDASDLVQPDYSPGVCERDLYCPNMDGGAGLEKRPRVSKAAVKCLPPVPVVWVRTDEVDTYMEALLSVLGTERKFVLVTSASAKKSPGRHSAMLHMPGLVRWFGTHGVPGAHPKFTALPVGLAEVSPVAAAVKALGGGNGDVDGDGSNAATRPPVAFDEAAALAAKPDAPLAVWNARMTSDGRRELHARLCGKDTDVKRVLCEEYVSFAESDATGPLAHKLALYKRLASGYKFWISPESEARDSHRTWEALAVGLVPIVTRASFPLGPDAVKDLPVLVLNSWDELTDELLVKEATGRFSRANLRDPAAFPRKMLTREYWTQRIRQAAADAASEADPEAAPAAWTGTRSLTQWPRCWGRRDAAVKRENGE